MDLGNLMDLGIGVLMDLGIGVIVFLAISITTIVVAIKVDFVALLKFRRKIRIERAQRICPHINIQFDKTTNNMLCQSLFESPTGTASWICTQCSLVALSESAVKRSQAYWLENPLEWPKQMKKFWKLVDKL